MTTSYTFTPMDKQLLYSTVPERLYKFAEETPNKETCVFYSVNGSRSSLTYAELYQKSHNFAKGLVRIGIKPGDIVGIGLPNIAEWLICHFGIVMTGAIALGIVFGRKDGGDVIHSITKAGNCVALIFDAGESHNKLKIVKKFISGTDNFGKIKNQTMKHLEFAVFCGNEISSDYPFTIDRVLELGADSNKSLPSLSPDDICMVNPTSGTTGNPKLIPKTHVEILCNRQATNRALNIQQSDRIFSSLPFTWIGGYISMNLILGCTRITTENMLSHGTLDTIVKTCIDIIEREECNVSSIIGPCLYAMMDPSIQLGTQFPLKTVIVGGYPLQKSIAGAVGRITKRLVISYSGTEFNVISQKVIDDQKSLTDYNCGVPIPGVEVNIVDHTGKTCSRNETGTIYIRSRWQFSGYMNDQEQTQKILKTGGWLNTDDLGYVTNLGEIISLGRQKDVITVSGALMSPYLIESMLSKHSDVKSVVIVPIPDAKAHQQICACIIRNSGSTVTWESIEECLRNEMTAKEGTIEISLFFPRYHLFMESFPMTTTGKVMRNELAVKARTEIATVLQLKNSMEKECEV